MKYTKQTKEVEFHPFGSLSTSLKGPAHLPINQRCWLLSRDDILYLAWYSFPCFPFAQLQRKARIWTLAKEVQFELWSLHICNKKLKIMEKWQKTRKRRKTQCDCFCKLWIFLKVRSNCIFFFIIFCLQPITDLPFTENTFGNGYWIGTFYLW